MCAKMDVADLRATYRQEMASLSRSLPERVAAVHVESVHSGPVGMRIYRPDDDTVSELLVYFFGGGFVVGDLDCEDKECRRLATDLGMRVAAVNYRLGPEHTFEAAFEDAHAACSWLREQATCLRVHRFSVAGFSAGAALAIDVAKSLDAKFQLLVAPLITLDDLPVHLSPRMARALDAFVRHARIDKGDSRICSIAHCTQSPPTCIVSFGRDLFGPANLEYARRLRALGTTVRSVHVADGEHRHWHSWTVDVSGEDAFQRSVVACRDLR